MDAVLSGHAGVALLLDGDKLSSLHFEDDGEALPRSPGEVHLLFAGAQDLEFLENVGMEEVRGHLDLAGTRIDALHLALNLLDPELSHETRRYAAEDLEELLADDRIDRWVESVLFAHPLPRSADPVGALSACTGRTERTRALLGKLESLQPVILEVQQAWEAIPGRLFATDEDRKHALSVAVKEGLFRDLVARRAAGERVDDFLLKSLMNPALRQIRDARHVLMEWVADFREPRKEPPPLAREISYVAEDTEWEREEQGRQWVDVQAVLGQIEWRKSVISRAMGVGDLDQARHEIDRLVEFQLEQGEPVHACKSLCDLAIRAKALGFHKLQLELTGRSIRLKDDDAWSWAQHGDALLRNGQLDQALRAYDNAVLFGERLVARNGRAEVLRAQNRLPEALAAYDSVIAEFPGNVVARTGRAEVLKGQNLLEDALLAYQSVMQDFPGDLVARNGLACVLATLDRTEEALALLPSKAPTHEEDWIGYHIRGMILLRTGHLEEAVRIFKEGIEKNPRPAGRDYFRTALAIACLRTEDYSEATAVLSDVASPRLVKEATVLRFHAFGGAGDLGRAAEEDRALEPVAFLPRVREIRDELRRRFIERKTPRHSDDWLIRGEIDLLLAAA